MFVSTIRFAAVLLLLVSPAGPPPVSPAGQAPNDPFPDPIPATEGAITVGVVEFAQIPDVDGEPARMMSMEDEPGTGRLFVSDMRGIIYSVGYDGSGVTRYLDLTASRWDLDVQASRSELGLQSFAFHPQFAQAGTPGFGKLYAWLDSSNTAPAPDFVPGGGGDSHDTILVVGAVAAAVIVGMFAVTHLSTGDWNYMGGHRKSFAGPYPLQYRYRTFDTIGSESGAWRVGARLPIPRFRHTATG